MLKISSGSEVLDRLLGGGLERGVITTLFGPAGSGKSNIAMLAALSVASRGRKVVFIDTENSFSVERVAQLAPQNYKTLLKNIILLEPTNFKEQKKYMSQLPELVAVKKPELIIVDSVVMLYRLQRGSEATITQTNKELANQLAVLSGLARKKSIPVLVTNQVYSDFKNSKLKMVGGDLLKYWSKCIVKLEYKEGVRKACIWKHRALPSGKAVYFDIRNRGIVEVGKPKRKFGLF